MFCWGVAGWLHGWGTLPILGLLRVVLVGALGSPGSCRHGWEGGDFQVQKRSAKSAPPQREVCKLMDLVLAGGALPRA